jgi:hypothetical protein
VIAVWLVAVGSVVARNRPETSSAVQGGVAVMRRAIPSSAQVIADDPLIAFLADRPIPPALCDTSEMRMRAGWLTAAMLSAALSDPRVHGLVLWRGTFRRFARGVLGDAANRFPRRWTLGADHEILTR